MLIRDDGSTVGTLGGGCMEAEVVDAAIEAMEKEACRSLLFDLNEKAGGLVCGGRVTVFLEPLIPPPHLIILGAGHVGKALSSLAHFIGFRVIIVDNRAEFASPSSVPSAHETVHVEFADAFDRITVRDKTCVVVATRGHLHDLEALRAALKTEAGYIGLLGSKRKRALLFKMLREEGFSEGDIERIITPVGLSIGAITPEEIAVSIAAQLIEHRRNHDSRLRAPACGGSFDADGHTEAGPSPGGDARPEALC